MRLVPGKHWFASTEPVFTLFSVEKRDSLWHSVRRRPNWFAFSKVTRILRLVVCMKPAHDKFHVGRYDNLSGVLCVWSRTLVCARRSLGHALACIFMSVWRFQYTKGWYGYLSLGSYSLPFFARIYLCNEVCDFCLSSAQTAGFFDRF